MSGFQVQSDQYIPVEDIHDEMSQLERQLDQLEQRGVELESKLRDSPSGTRLTARRLPVEMVPYHALLPHTHS